MKSSGFVVALLLLLFPQPASAWCEIDCVALCVARAEGQSRHAAADCVRAQRCGRFADGVCEPKRRAERIDRMKQQRAAPPAKPVKLPCGNNACLFKGF